MSDDKNDSGIEVQEYRIDWESLHPRANLLIDKLEMFQRTYPGFDFHLQGLKEKDRLWIFTNIAAGDPAKANNNIVLEYYDGRVFIGTGALGGTPYFHRDPTHWHRIESVEKKLDHMLARLIGRPDAFKYRVKSQSKPAPT